MRARRVACAVILAVCLGAPLVEAFDGSDDTLHAGDDTEANAVIAAICVGLTISAAGTVVSLIKRSATGSEAAPTVSLRTRSLASRLAPQPNPTVSPPLFALRI